MNNDYELRLRLHKDFRVASVGSNFVKLSYKGIKSLKIKTTKPKSTQKIFELLSKGLAFKSYEILKRDSIANQILKFGLFQIELIVNKSIAFSAFIECPISTKIIELRLRNLKWNKFVFLEARESHIFLSSTEALADIKLHKKTVKRILTLLPKAQIKFSDFNDLDLVQLLFDLNFVTIGGKQIDSARKYWEFHDRLLLSRSRMRSIYDLRRIGAIYPFDEPTPASKNIHSQKQIRIKEPNDIGLPVYLKNRESARVGPRKPGISKVDLIRFLFLFKQKQKNKAGQWHHAYPIAGNIGSPEVLIINHSIKGIPKGILTFDYEKKSLSIIDQRESHLNILVSNYSQFWFKEIGRPQAVIQILRHYPSLAWKYRGLTMRVLASEGGGMMLCAQLIADHLNLKCCPFGLGPMNLLDSKTLSTSLDWEWIPIIEFSLEKD